MKLFDVTGFNSAQLDGIREFIRVAGGSWEWGESGLMITCAIPDEWVDAFTYSLYKLEIPYRVLDNDK